MWWRLWPLYSTKNQWSVSWLGWHFIQRPSSALSCSNWDRSSELSAAQRLPILLNIPLDFYSLHNNKPHLSSIWWSFQQIQPLCLRPAVCPVHAEHLVCSCEGHLLPGVTREQSCLCDLLLQIRIQNMQTPDGSFTLHMLNLWLQEKSTGVQSTARMQLWSKLGWVFSGSDR